MCRKRGFGIVLPVAVVTALCVPAIGLGVNLTYEGASGSSGSFWNSDYWVDSSSSHKTPDSGDDLSFVDKYNVTLTTSEADWTSVPSSTTISSFDYMYWAGNLTLTSVPQYEGGGLGSLTISHDFDIRSGTLTLDQANVNVLGQTFVCGPLNPGILKIAGVGPAGDASLTTAVLQLSGGNAGPAQLLLDSGAIVHVTDGFESYLSSCQIGGGAALTNDGYCNFYHSALQLSDNGAFNCGNLDFIAGHCNIGGGGALTGLDCTFRGEGTVINVEQGGLLSANTLMLKGNGTGSDADALVTDGTLSVLASLDRYDSGTLTLYADANVPNKVSLEVAGSNGLVTTNELDITAQQGKTASATFDNGATLDLQLSDAYYHGNARLWSDDSSQSVLVFDHGAKFLAHQWGSPALGDLAVGGPGTVVFKNGATGQIGNAQVEGSTSAPAVFNVDGVGAKVSANWFILGGNGGDWEPGWQAQLNVSNDAEVVIGRWDLNGYDTYGTGNLMLYAGGKIDVTGGGAVYVGAGTDPYAANPTPELQSGAVVLGAYGRIDSTGTIVGDLVNHGGVFHAGHSTGTAHIIGDYTQTAGDLLFDIGQTNYSVLDVTGKTEIDGGRIVFEKFGTGGILTGDMLFFTNSITIGDGVSIVISDDLQKYGFTFDPRTGQGNVPVPEPATMTVMAFGLALAAKRRRR